MSDAEVREELLQLRKQVAALSAARRRHKGKAEPAEDDLASASGQDEGEPTIKQQIEDLIKLVQDDIRDMPAMPTLAVFILGVLVGRYLR